MHRLTALLLMIAAALSATARGYEHMLDADMAPGWVLPTSSYFRGANPGGYRFGPMLHGGLRWRAALTSSDPASRLYPGLYMGAGVRAITFFKPSLTGAPAALYIFQGADISRLSPRLTLGYEWQFGASAPWQIRSRSHPEQMVNGSPVCAMLGASLLLHYRLNADWQLTAGIDLAHYSNGNTRWPNAGTNTASLRLGVSRRLGTSGHPATAAFTDTLPAAALTRQQRWSLDLMAYGAWRKKCYHDPDNNPYPYPGHFGVAGLNVAPMFELSRRWRAGASLDLVFDESAVPKSHIIGDEESGVQPYYIRPSFFSQTAAGIAASVEYSMPLFALNVTLGRNLVAGCGELRYFYQTLALRTYITGRTWLNVGYSLRNFTHPRHLMLGIGFRIGGRRAPLPLNRL